MVLTHFDTRPRAKTRVSSVDGGRSAARVYIRDEKLKTEICDSFEKTIEPISSPFVDQRLVPCPYTKVLRKCFGVAPVPGPDSPLHRTIHRTRCWDAPDNISRYELNLALDIIFWSFSCIRHGLAASGLWSAMMSTPGTGKAPSVYISPRSHASIPKVTTTHRASS